MAESGRDSTTNELLEEVRLACSAAAFVRLHPVIYASLQQREQLFKMGARRECVDSGFRNRTELRKFIADTRLLNEVLLTWYPGGYNCGLLLEQEYEIRSDGCDIPFWLLRELLDFYGFTGKQLRRIHSRSQAEDIYHALRALPDYSPSAILERRQARHLAWSREQDEVKERIRVANERQTKAIVTLIERIKNT
ncbi:hypothetical protein KFL_003260150 [Klebsormidium nitens]|uniref:Uncharacterized protein n=1 Tax=Klebsormidium nitens TaxID=105231 RepID=A0A1Y1IAP6_KLENI|nr:hypothetical protein KFL_003260150 [Klebsormidium nitens]|eukprot:GAQ87032.1 hypothetical protein KFL_003260150 [Klebsormidium nitens]